MKATRKRLVLWSTGILVVLLIGLALRPKPLAADFAVVERGSLRVTIDEEGETRVRDRFVVSAPLAGRVLRIELEPGDAVRVGETVLATFQPSDPILLDARTRAEAEARVGAAEAALGLARAERDRAEAELRFARSDEQRYRALAEEEIVSRERVETAELEARTREEALEAAEFAVRSADRELAVARAGLLDTAPEETGGRVITLRSPVDGLVLRRLRESEAVVPAGEA
ncbi:MAG: efflux transporter periplasmic adaptor subunit, partial [bacterium]|nr:efflux transporter periplasmic adaptor subunit [bacterium]